MHQRIWIKHVKFFSLLFILVPLLTGCWDRLEIEQRATILGIAIDVAEPEEAKKEGYSAHTQKDLPTPPTGMVRITAQIAIPGRLPLGPGMDGGGGGKEQKPIWILQVSGHTIDDAFSNLQQQVADILFFGHLRVIVISEEIAKRGVEELNDFLRRFADVRRTAWMIVSQEKAEKVMRAAPQLERIPTLYLSTTMDNAVKIGKFPNDLIGIFWSKLSSKGQEPFLPYVKIKEGENIEISGLAYFRDDKMVGVTKPLEIGYYMAIMEINPGGYNAIFTVPGEPGTAMFRARQRKSKIEVKIKNGRPEARINVHVEGDLREIASPPLNVNQSEDLKRLEKALEEGAEKEFKELIKKTQEDRSDIFGFGEYVRAKHSQYWNQEIKTRNKWQEMYKEIPVEVQLTVNIRRVGMKAR